MGDALRVDMNFGMHIEDMLVFCFQTRHFMVMRGENAETFDFTCNMLGNGPGQAKTVPR